MQLVALIQTQPVQFLALLAGQDRTGIKFIGQVHVRSQLGDYRHIHAFPDLALLLQIDVGHVPDHDVW